MKTVAIISEYNPFHNGHLYQINKIREELGDDTAIISIMSGNFTQRGDIAILEKWERAKIALHCGVNLVLELPFPYSMSSAELFARAGVWIADRLGVVDYLSFGSEYGEIEPLLDIAKAMSTREFEQALANKIKEKDSQGVGYPKIMQSTLEEISTVSPPENIFTANNILALEYIKALIKLNSAIIPHTIKRNGADYSSESVVEELENQSATAIRQKLLKNESAEKYIPFYTQKIFSEEKENGNAPCDASRLYPAILSYLRLNEPSDKKAIHDADGGLYNRLRKMSFEATDLNSLIDLSATKKYTTARIKRAVWYSFFGVTSSNVKELPEFTQVLALDTVGQALLKKIRKNDGIAVITKPAHKLTSSAANLQKELSDKADSVFQLTKQASPASSIYKRSPFVKK